MYKRSVRPVANLLPVVLDAAAGDLAAPAVEELDADVEAFAMTPLFDGSELELI
jgi:hypothetical protein